MLKIGLALLRNLWRDSGPRYELRKLHNEELNVLCSAPNIVRAIKSRRMRWLWHVARMGEGRGVYRVLVGNLWERDHWGDPGLHGRIILIWIFRKWDVGVWTGSGWFRIGTSGGLWWKRIWNFEFHKIRGTVSHLVSRLQLKCDGTRWRTGG